MQEKFDKAEPATIHITDANKGGLMTEIGGIQGFLPVSQLSPAHYPRVEGGDKDEILNRLRQYIGSEFLVKVINCDKEGNKLIFSEKAVDAEQIKTKIDKYQVSDKVTGRITGIVDFGLFLSLDPQIEGLVHISEISWSRVTDLRQMFKVGEAVEAMIIGIENGRISLSLKRLQPDPWVLAASKFNVGDVVSGQITKITPFGAFVSIEDGIDGLVHVSELSDDHIVDPGQIVDLGKDYKFKIISIEPESHRLGLSLKEAGAPLEKSEKPKKEKVAKAPANKGEVAEDIDSKEAKAAKLTEKVEEASEDKKVKKPAKKKSATKKDQTK